MVERGRKINKEKKRLETKGKRGGNPRVRFNSLPQHLNSALYYLNAWNKLKDKRESALKVVVGT